MDELFLLGDFRLELGLLVREILAVLLKGSQFPLDLERVGLFVLELQREERKKVLNLVRVQFPGFDGKFVCSEVNGD